MTNTFKSIVSKSLRGAIDKSVDYIAEDGLYHCGYCGKPKQMYIHCLDRDWLVGFVCKCDKSQHNAEQIAREKSIKENLADCFKGGTAHTAPDDAAETQQAQFCAEYAKNFKPGAKWLVMYGDVGTGKSYRAAKICREIIKAGYRAKFTTLPEIERRLWNGDKAEIYSSLDSYDLLVLDDFGAERQTEYLKEIRYNVIDMRYNSGKALIITTNIAKFSGDDMADKRIFSRIREKSAFVRFSGIDRRMITDIDFEHGWENL